MRPRLKAYLIGLGLLALAAAFGARAAWKYQYRDSPVGAALSGIVAAGFLVGGMRYLITGRTDTPKQSDPPAEQTGGSP